MLQMLLTKVNNRLRTPSILNSASQIYATECFNARCPHSLVNLQNPGYMIIWLNRLAEARKKRGPFEQCHLVANFCRRAKRCSR